MAPNPLYMWYLPGQLLRARKIGPSPLYKRNRVPGEVGTLRGARAEFGRPIGWRSSEIRHRGALARDRYTATVLPTRDNTPFQGS